MKSAATKLSARGVAKAAGLLGSASFLAIASATAASAAEPVATVTITGSLIAGAAAVGVPVTSLGAEDYVQSGSVTTAELLRSLPTVEVDTTTSSLVGGGTTGFGQNVAIHGITGSGGDATTLMLINGKRWPVQGHGGDTVDPSLVPSIAVERVDVLTSGASAVYGSDAITGVLNVITKKRFNGAQTQLTYSQSPEVGRRNYVFSQLFGRNWDSGNVTLALEWYEQQRMPAGRRDYYTTNYEPWGLFDNTPLASSNPGVVTTGAPSSSGLTRPRRFSPSVGTRYCVNCYAIPHGTGWNYGDTQAHTNPTDPTPTTTWATLQANQFVPLQANTQNQRNGYLDADALPAQQRFALYASVDQDLFDDLNIFGLSLGPVSFAANGFHNHRQSVAHVPHNLASGNSSEHWNGGQNPGGMVIPLSNPYRPAGAPDNIRVNYSFSPDLDGSTRIGASIVESRWETQLLFNALPFDWTGDLYFSSSSERNETHSTNMINQNHVVAALGGTVAKGPNEFDVAYTKPDDIPYLNVFCDSLVYQCNAKSTLDYITGGRDQDNRWKIHQFGANFSGPVFELPGGMLEAAISYEHQSHKYYFQDWNNSRVHNKFMPQTQRDVAKQQSTSYFGQINIPLIGGDFSAPLFESVDVELGYRFDKFDFQDAWVKTPKVAVNWGVGWGLQLRGAWGKSFRAPGFGQRSAASGSRALAGNILGGGGGEEFEFLCLNDFPGGPAAGTAVPGSPTAIFNPTCNTTTQALFAPGGLVLNGGSGIGDPARGILDRSSISKGLGPETAKQYVLGVNYTPTEGILSGLTVDVSYFNIHLTDTIRGGSFGDSNPDDPESRLGFMIRPDILAGANPADPTLSIFSPINAPFLAVIQELQATGSYTAPQGNATLNRVQWIWDGANLNSGGIRFTGIDIFSRYDWDMGNLGQWHVGASGYYELDTVQQAVEGAALISDYTDQNSGGRLQRMRFRTGWTDGTWGATLFANWKGHTGPETGNRLPECYFQPNEPACYPGAPFYPQPSDVFFNGAPAHVEFDLNLSYNTGNMPAMEILQNINVNLSIQNVLDRKPPFQFTSRSRAREMRAYDRRWSELQRTVVLTLTKDW